ncbi:MAG: chemotaxis protein CheW [Candidatus Kapaibacterium sp.]|jgi:purine-binding chemotaxis protein CheW|nr:chemotaxis protein CheW [Ignavibacteria bacterium]MBN8573742.1 chemotaxis protein CheW [Candidatus Kapabacteria bacterium]HRE58944.1 chemotaxis protein CheW [Candidatus Kapabacteria bacterium]HRK59551.1 chemotaxis protein CheW [Candidatus Kapabacteria bacterium]
MEQHAAANTSDTILQLVSFNIGDEEFGVDILGVQEINRMTEVTRVPNAPSYVEGVINLRGKVIPVIDLRKRLMMNARGHDQDTRIIVVEIENKVIGFVVDKVNEVLRIPQSVTEAPPSMVSGIKSDYITAIGKLTDRLIILLDLDKILSDDEKAQISQTAA